MDPAVAWGTLGAHVVNAKGASGALEWGVVGGRSTSVRLACALRDGPGGVGPPLQMLRAKSNPRISTPEVSSDQSVDWEQRDFTQTIQLGMTQLTAFLNEFGRRVPVTPTRCPHR